MNRGSMGGGQRPGGRPMGGPMGGGPMGGGPMGGLGMTGKKAKNFWGTTKRLLGYFKPEAWLLGLVLFAAIASTVFGVIGPKIMGLAITKLFDGFVAKAKYAYEIGMLHIPAARL